MRAGRLARLCVVPALAGLFLIATAAPAWAHAILISTDPPKDGVAAKSPSQLSLSFNENVEVSFGSIRVFTCAGQRITTGAPRHAAASDHTVELSVPKLDPGVYLVAWRVISADAHPVAGTYSFRIGPGAPPSVTGCAAETTARSSTTVGVLFGIARVGVFVGLALLIGGVVFLLCIAGGTSAVRWTRRLVWIGWIVLTSTTVAAVMLQGPYAGGAGAGDALKWTVVHDVLRTRFGHTAVARIVLLAVALVLLTFLGRIGLGWVGGTRRAPVWWLVPAAIVGVGLAATPGYAGHAATGDWTGFAVVFDTIHVLAMSVWLGGLVALLVAALGGGFSGGLRRALTTFSRLAFWCVVALIVTGMFASWRQVGFAIRGYTDTSYGNILLVKLVFVAALVALAAVSRSIVRKRQSAPLDAPDTAVAAIDQRTVVGLRRSVAGEVALGLVVLAVTAALVQAQPARSELTPRLYSSTASAGSGKTAMTISATVDPARVGLNEIHVYTLTPKGADLTVRDISAKLVSADGTSVPANLVRAGPNHFVSTDATIPAAGKYRMLVEVTQIVDERAVVSAAVFDVPIR